jgi:FkbM family methyltransferase
LGYKFVCHIGDLAEHPFYHRHAYRKELELCAAWLRQEASPVMYDVGANDGFFCSQIAQMMGDHPINIYAIEPVPATFAKLVQSVHRLGLEDRIYPIAAAAIDDKRLVHVRYSRKKSLLAQVATSNLKTRAGDEIAITSGITLDELYELADNRPTLLKSDVEGSEVAVLKGARDLISNSIRPAIAFEFSPLTLIECGETPKSLAELITGYKVYYIDDQSGQRMRFGDPIIDFEAIQWTCNLFAVPEVEELSNRWTLVLEQARRSLGL